MKKCVNCGATIKNNSDKFCSNCGKNIETKDNLNNVKVTSKEKGKIKKVISIILIVIGIVAIPTQEDINGVFTSVFIALFGVSLLPTVYEKISNKINIPYLKLILPLLVIFLFGMVNSVLDNNSNLNKDDEKLQQTKEDFNEFNWPSSDIAKLIPVPKSNLGKIEWEASYGFVIYVGNTTKDDFLEYIQECKNAGFNVNYRKGDNYYYASDNSGYRLTLNYKSANIMFIRVDEPKNKTEDSSKDDKENSNENSNSKENNNKNNNDNSSKSDTNSDNKSNNYKVGDTISCKHFDVKLESFIIKKKGTAIDSFYQISDPEWIGVILTVKNTDKSTHTFYTSQVEIRNSNGEFINHSSFSYAIWGDYLSLRSPELAPGGIKTGYVQFANNNQNNDNLALIINCKDKLLLGGPNYVFDLKN
mgnify:CR=1 FL=1